MIKEGNIKEFEWIKHGVKTNISSGDESYRGNTVGNLLPNNFSKYIKILHPIYKDKLFTDKNTLWSENFDDETIEGTLEKEQMYEIISILKSLNCEKYFYYYDWLKISDWSQDRLFEGSLEGIYGLMKLEEIRATSEGSEKFSPSYCWDINKTLCICTDYDLEFTIVGCNNELFTNFMKIKCLECIEVKYDTRIDYKSME